MPSEDGNRRASTPKDLTSYQSTPTTTTTTTATMIETPKEEPKLTKQQQKELRKSQRKNKGKKLEISAPIQQTGAFEAQLMKRVIATDWEGQSAMNLRFYVELMRVALWAFGSHALTAHWIPGSKLLALTDFSHCSRTWDPCTRHGTLDCPTQ